MKMTTKNRENTEIYLIRHGEAEVNTVFSSIINGRSEWSNLTANGIAQAKRLGERLHDEGIEFDAQYSSSAIRAQQTARNCLDVIDGSLRYTVQVDPTILEFSQGDWEGQLKESIYSREDVREGLDGDGWNFIPGDKLKGESQAQVARRMKNWVEQKVDEHAGGRIAAFSHGGAIKYLLTDLFGFDKDTAFKIPIDNTSISIIRYEQGEPTLVTINDVSHLEASGLSKVAGIFDDRHCSKELPESATEFRGK